MKRAKELYCQEFQVSWVTLSGHTSKVRRTIPLDHPEVVAIVYQSVHRSWLSFPGYQSDVCVSLSQFQLFHQRFLRTNSQVEEPNLAHRFESLLGEVQFGVKQVCSATEALARLSLIPTTHLISP